MQPARPFPRPSARTILRFLLLLGAAPAAAVAQTGDRAPRTPLVVLASEGDVYRPLAVEIAEREAAPLAATADEALALRPDFLVWVVSPSELSDRALVEYGKAVARAGAMPALGFVSGASVDNARSLYGRSLTTGAPSVALASGTWGGHRNVIRYLGAAPGHDDRLDTGSFRRALEGVDGLFFRGHGGPGYLRFTDSVTFVPGDMPARVPRLVATYACNTFRMWTGARSISLAFTDAGAAAYIGYSYSPLPGFQMTEGFPFRHTWPAFPIGRLVQVQSAASLRGLFAFPAYHLLGNPRLSFRDAPPYKVVADRNAAGERIVELADAPEDILPIRIEGGAAFDTTEVTGLGRVWRDDPFYNGRLQVLDVGPDRYLLVQHQDGPLTIRLSMDRPLLATIGRAVLGGLDLCLIVFPAADRVTCGAFVILAIAGIIWGTLRRTWRARTAMVALAAGALLAACHATYAVLRVSRLDVVSSFDRQLHAGMFGATAALVAWGTLRYFASRTRKGRVLGITIAVLNVGSMGVVWLAWPLLFNQAVIGRLGSPLYNARAGLLTLVGATALAVMAAAAFTGARRSVRIDRGPDVGPARVRSPFEAS